MKRIVEETLDMYYATVLSGKNDRSLWSVSTVERSLGALSRERKK